MIDNPDRVQVLYLPFPHDDLQTEGLIVSPREIDLKPKVGIVLPYGMYGTTAKVLRTDANGNLGVSVQGAAGALPATFQDLLGHTLGPLVPEAGGGYAAPFTMSAAQGGNIIPSRTDAASYIGPDLAAPSAYEVMFFGRVTAASGTSPTFSLSIQGKDSAGNYSALASQSSVNAVSGLLISIGPNTSATMLSPTYRVTVTIGGTTPSFTWLLDMYYR